MQPNGSLAKQFQHACHRPSAPWLISSHWTGERIDYSVHGSFCALGNAVPDILRCLRSVLRHVGCPSGGTRPNSANGDGNGQNDRKECFHGTKVSLLPVRVRLRISNEDCSPMRIHGRDAAPTPTGFAEIVGDYFPILHAVSSQMTKDDTPNFPQMRRSIS
jgi:hypothetical protein